MGFFEGLFKQKVKSVFFGAIMDGRNEVYREFRVTNPDINADFNVMFALSVVMAAFLRVSPATDDDVYNVCVADIQLGLVDYFKGRKDAPINTTDYVRQAFATSFQEHVNQLIQRGGQFGLNIWRQDAMDFLITTLEKNHIAQESEFPMLYNFAMDILIHSYCMTALTFRNDNRAAFQPKHLRAG